MPRNIGPSATLASTGFQGSSASVWKTKLAPLGDAGRPAGRRPSRCPRSGIRARLRASAWSTCRSRSGPTTAQNWPGSTVRRHVADRRHRGAGRGHEPLGHVRELRCPRTWLRMRSCHAHRSGCRSGNGSGRRCGDGGGLRRVMARHLCSLSSPSPSAPRPSRPDALQAGCAGSEETLAAQAFSQLSSHAPRRASPFFSAGRRSDDGQGPGAAAESAVTGRSASTDRLISRKTDGRKRDQDARGIGTASRTAAAATGPERPTGRAT